MYCTSPGYALLKKYGNFLLNKFPPDHLETLAKVSKQYPLDDILVDSIVTASCPAEGNQRILKICMLMVQTDKCLNEFCSTMEKLVDNPKLSKIMEVFRHGTASLYASVCTYIRTVQTVHVYMQYIAVHINYTPVLFY